MRWCRCSHMLSYTGSLGAQAGGPHSRRQRTQRGTTQPPLQANTQTRAAAFDVCAAGREPCACGRPQADRPEGKFTWLPGPWSTRSTRTSKPACCCSRHRRVLLLRCHWNVPVRLGAVWVARCSATAAVLMQVVKAVASTRVTLSLPGWPDKHTPRPHRAHHGMQPCVQQQCGSRYVAVADSCNRHNLGPHALLVSPPFPVSMDAVNDSTHQQHAHLHAGLGMIRLGCRTPAPALHTPLARQLLQLEIKF